FNSPCDKVKADIADIAKQLVVYKSIKELFTTKVPKKVALAKSDIFGKEKQVYLSSDTVQSHFHHTDVLAFHYSLIPRMLKDNKMVFIHPDKNNVDIIIKKLGNYYRLVIKNIENKDEIFILSLVRLGTNKKKMEQEVKKLRKRYKEK
ncbi:hypothetical protein, partial [Campylobacter geochelonis]|uniref:hypothetical protein n=1 Tax=Campylobacter geochelonis TaxID=1780362 RepID=UPI0013F4C74D